MILSKIRLDQILFDRKLAESKSKAQAMIMAGQVCVEDKVINKSGYNINPDAKIKIKDIGPCLLYTSPSPRDRQKSRMPSSA